MRCRRMCSRSETKVPQLWGQLSLFVLTRQFCSPLWARTGCQTRLIAEVTFRMQVKARAGPSVLPLLRLTVSFILRRLQFSNAVSSHLGDTSAFCLFVSVPSQHPFHSISAQPIYSMGKSVVNISLKASSIRRQSRTRGNKRLKTKTGETFFFSQQSKETD